MTLKNKIAAAEKAIAGKGVLIDPAGIIIRLSVNADGNIRLCKNRFIINENIVLGAAFSTIDFKSIDTALDAFEHLKKDGSYFWREDDRVLYSP